MGKENNLEVYARACSHETIISWFSQILGAIKDLDCVESSPYIYRFKYKEKSYSVTIQENVEEGPFTSIFISGIIEPWPNSVEFARHIHRELKCQVRCDPLGAFPNVDPYSDVFLQITDSEEELIEWSDELIESEKQLKC